MIVKYREMIRQSSAPALVESRLERLFQEPQFAHYMENSQPDIIQDVINIIAISTFLYHFLCRHPDSISMIGNEAPTLESIEKIADIEELRIAKYKQLLRISWFDISNRLPYEKILLALSQLADRIINQVLTLIGYKQELPLCIFAMGKLGALELNYSSDVDILFICADNEDIKIDANDYHIALVRKIRQLANLLEQKTANGFLYRVDLNLRPGGRNAPLVISVNNAEHYYEASTEAWERFAWARARIIAGDDSLGRVLLRRLYHFVFHGTLSAEDLERFIKIKNEMAAIRQRNLFWNVKTGAGGIRDIEFFIQILQIVNANRYPLLQQTNTLKVLESLAQLNLIDVDYKIISQCYLFMRRLENRLQMVDEQQTHELPEDHTKRLIIARSLGFVQENDEQALLAFNKYLDTQREIARNCFESILPRKEHDTT